MRIVGIIAGVALVLYLGYRFLLPALFLSIGRGPVNETTVAVSRVTVNSEISKYDGSAVSAGEGHKFVNIDCHVNAHFGDIDVEDFQLVKARVDELGTEENVGNNMDEDYFYWWPVDSSGTTVDEIPTEAPEFDVRLTFKVPASATEGYLFYWGEYFGPLEFEATTGS